MHGTRTGATAAHPAAAHPTAPLVLLVLLVFTPTASTATCAIHAKRVVTPIKMPNQHAKDDAQPVHFLLKSVKPTEQHARDNARLVHFRMELVLIQLNSARIVKKILILLKLVPSGVFHAQLDISIRKKVPMSVVQHRGLGLRSLVVLLHSS